eukprot:2615844-Pleurochrysis_carterae.AAC.1
MHRKNALTRTLALLLAPALAPICTCAHMGIRCARSRTRAHACVCSCAHARARASAETLAYACARFAHVPQAKSEIRPDDSMRSAVTNR